MKTDEENKILLPHHEQQTLCTSRLSYRQGRKFTAVKVYTVTKESNHLLIFGVPSLNLKKEIKVHFQKFGKLVQFNLSTQHASESFTETYHAQFEKIQCARFAKKTLDTLNFYGGVLHICYAPEFETIEQTKLKLIQRQKDVLNRLRNIESDRIEIKKIEKPKIIPETQIEPVKKLNMGEVNTIRIDNEVPLKKRKLNKTIEKKPQIIVKPVCSDSINIESKSIEIVDCTNIENEVVTNINDHLNYNKFGNEIIRKIPQKPVNTITFNIKKS